MDSNATLVIFIFYLTVVLESFGNSSKSQDCIFAKGLFYFSQKRLHILSNLNKHIYMAVLWSKVLRKVQLRWKVENLKREWDVLRKWVYFEANFKNRSVFLKVGQWNKMAQTHSTVRDTVVTVTLKF